MKPSNRKVNKPLLFTVPNPTGLTIWKIRGGSVTYQPSSIRKGAFPIPASHPDVLQETS
jgi:hypothetical protein